MRDTIFGSSKYAFQEATLETSRILAEMGRTTAQAMELGATLTAGMTKAMLAPFSIIPGMNIVTAVTNNTMEQGVKIARRRKAECEMAGEELCEHHKPAWDIPETTRDGTKFAVREKTVLEKPFCNIVHFECEDALERPKLLLFAPLSGHHATLLRDTVKGLLPHYDVYVTDWVDAKKVPLSKGDFGFHDYISYAKDFIGAIEPDTVMAVCQPGPAVAAALALREQQGLKNPRSAVFMGSPIDIEAAPTEVTDYAKKHSLEYFKDNVIQEVSLKHPGRGREVYAGNTQLTAFMAMNLPSHLKKHMQQVDDMVDGNAEAVKAHRDFYREYLSVLDMPAKFYLETLKYVFGVTENGKKDRSLVEGRFVHEGQVVDFGNITKTAIMSVEGEKDDICGVGQTSALPKKLCRNLADNMKKSIVIDGVGHYGIFSGKRGWRNIIVPEIVAFTSAHRAPRPNAHRRARVSQTAVALGKLDHA